MDHSGFTEIAQLISLVIELKETFGEGWMKVFEALMGALLLLGLLPKALKAWVSKKNPMCAISSTT